MLVNNLFNEILIEPVTKHKANTIYIVSGYASATMAISHIEFLKKIIKNKPININLIIGMCVSDGLLRRTHEQFKKITQNIDAITIECNYLVKPAPVHSKIYAWFKDNCPISCFAGSANYTQNAFSNKQRELMVSADPQKARDYYMELLSECLNCLNSNIDQYITFHEKTYIIEKRKNFKNEIVETTGEIRKDIEFEKVTTSFLDKKGYLPKGSGLNWGQRKNREPNQAYIKLTSDIYKSNFFPPIKTHFTIITDDNKEIICSRAQQNGKAIHSTLNNSLIGEYFRHRLGLPNGAMVNKEDLEKYGRTDVDFYKIDDDTYLMDFSVNG